MMVIAGEGTVMWVNPLFGLDCTMGNFLKLLKQVKILPRFPCLLRCPFTTCFSLLSQAIPACCMGAGLSCGGHINGSRDACACCNCGEGGTTSLCCRCPLSSWAKRLLSSAGSEASSPHNSRESSSGRQGEVKRRGGGCL